MIKKLQALKAKKGFTLVELIVVIAIIGVLAAILVPTMLGYVTSSRVTSANSTAASMKNNIDSFLTTCDTNGYGMLKGSANNSTITVVVDGGAWTVKFSDVTKFKGGNGTAANGMTWADMTAGLKKGESKVGKTNPAQLLAIELADLFPEIQTASIKAYVEAGKCLALAYTADKGTAMSQAASETAADTDDCPGFRTGTASAPGGWIADTNGVVKYGWDNSTAGVSKTGLIVGTAPIVPLG
ncbi:MAG: type IV pilin protein [Oscillospiraceae bacterium]